MIIPKIGGLFIEIMKLPQQIAAMIEIEVEEEKTEK